MWRAILTVSLVWLMNGIATAAPREGAINTLADVFTALRACWVPPLLQIAPAEMQITVRLSFRRSGALLGPPRITYESKDITEEQRTAYRRAVMATLQRCTPLPFTEALGQAIAGRPLTIRFVDQRKQRSAERSAQDCLKINCFSV